MSPSRTSAFIPLTIVGLFALTAFVYWNGLRGGFLFDDFGNLPAIGANGPIDTWPAFWRYITSGHADPTGRPLTLLSFLIDARDWPASPAPFLRTNLILHLINGALLTLLLWRLGLHLCDRVACGARADAVRARRRAGWAALTGAALWLLHPLFVSTTLYIVQREAMLPATFELIGLLLWLHGRRLALGGRHVRGIAWILVGLGGGTLLAVLSKANGALLPLFALTIEWTLLQRPAGRALPAVGRHRQLASARAAGGARPTDAESEIGIGQWDEHTPVGRIKEQRDGSACLRQGWMVYRKQAAPSLAFLEPPYGATATSGSGGHEDHAPSDHSQPPSPRRKPRSSDLRHAPLKAPDPGLRRGDGDGGMGKSEASTTSGKSRRIYAWALVIIAGVPTVALLAFLALRYGPALVAGTHWHRPWTEGQRLLTEPRVLLDYLRLLWLPRPFTTGLFNDQIAASTSLFSPATTLPAMAGVLALLAFAICVRKRWPAVALAILFYFAGQLLESGIIPLELYFEHRNYIPAMLMFWPLALWLCGVRQRAAPRDLRAPPNPVIPAHVGRVQGWTRLWGARKAGIQCLDVREKRRRWIPAFAGMTDEGSRNAGMSGGKSRTSGSTPLQRDGSRLTPLKPILAVGLLLALALMTHARASVWGNTAQQALIWARLNPDSPRAQANAAQSELQHGHVRAAIARLRPALAAQPKQAQLAINLVGAECRLGHIDPATLAATRRALRTTANPGALLVHWFDRAIAQTGHPPCPQMTLPMLSSLAGATLDNTTLMKNAGQRQNTWYIKGRIALAAGEPRQALSDFDTALAQQVRYAAALKQAALLGASGHPRLGLAHLDYFHRLKPRLYENLRGMARIHAWVLERQNYWPHELARLRRNLRDAAEDSTSPPNAHRSTPR